MSRLLDTINSPEDLKKLKPVQLKKLAHEIRSFLIHSVSKTGGHLGANLGVVELTLALHYVFNSPEDKFIWDVGHQAYVHKILTGRKDRFRTLRKQDGLSGFPKRDESTHDHFNTGHSSTSISAALGMAAARDLTDEDYEVIPIIGDGSLTGGMAFEALNNAGRSKSKTIVILNDNQMSIAPNVGSLTKYLCDVRTEPVYLDVKEDVERFLKRIPAIGAGLVNSVRSAKDNLRYMLVPGVLFEEMGFNYFGPIDGHNLPALVSVLKSAKKLKGPIFIHVKTVKGKGYLPAEKEPCKYHGVPPFNAKTGEFFGKSTGTSYSKAFGQQMLHLAKEHKNMVAITAAMPDGTGLLDFAKEYPERFFDVGIAEQHAVTFAAGLAAMGKRPVVAIYSSFLQRAYDQVLHDVCLQNLPVIFALDRAGIVGADGETHQGIFDISYLSHLPNLTVMAPKNQVELDAMMAWALTHDGPVVIRYPRGNVSQVYGDQQEAIELGKAEVLQKGKQVALIAYGAMNDLAHEVAEKLKEENIDITVINGRFSSPIDEDLYIELAKDHGCFITLEENMIHGGFGTKIMTALSHQGCVPSHMKCFGFSQGIVEQGERSSALQVAGLDQETVINYIKNKITK